MKAMVLRHVGDKLAVEDRDVPSPGQGQVRVRIDACAVCRTDAHLVDGELSGALLPVVPGHQIVGTVDETGKGGSALGVGQRVGIPWLAATCGVCAFCRTGRENLCDRARFTGFHVDGGYAEYAIADARFCFPLDETSDAAESAPLLCAGLIGYRSVKMAGDAETIGFYGFGAAAHLAIQVCRHRGQRVFAFTRPGDTKGQEFARELGAEWASGSDEAPPRALDAAVIFAPAGELVPVALAAVTKGGTVVCGGIHMSDIPSFPYTLLWGERCLRSVANLTRADAREFLAIAREARVKTEITRYPLSEANVALDDLRQGRRHGSLVLVPGT
jgi:propanol-preferring alcohol dehydrogenase